MALIVEDGTGVENANTYVDIAYVEDYAEVRGFALPSTDELKEQYIIRAMDYLEALAGEFQGVRSIDDQLLQWPRKDIWLNSLEFAIDEIPEQLRKAQAQLVVEQQLRTPLYPKPLTSTVEGFITQKTVGPLTKKYSSAGGLANSRSRIIIASVEVFLRPLIGNSRVLRTHRIL